jgi:hypothetical protein
VGEPGEELVLRPVGGLGGGARLLLSPQQPLAVRLAAQALLVGRPQRGGDVADLLDGRLRRRASGTIPTTASSRSLRRSGTLFMPRRAA